MPSRVSLILVIVAMVLVMLSSAYGQSGTGIISDPDTSIIVDTRPANPAPIKGPTTCTRSGGITICY